MYPQLTSSGEPSYEGVLSQWVILENNDSSFWHEEAKEYLLDKMIEEEYMDKKDIDIIGFYVYSNICYEFDKDTGLLKLFGEGTMPNYIMGELEWLAEWYNSFENKILNIEIEDGITSIGSFAFYHCQNIKNLNLPNSIRKIGNNAFCGCYSLESIEIPDDIISIDFEAFSNCNKLKEVMLPKGLKQISCDAFAECENLEKIYMSRNTLIVGCIDFYNNNVKTYDNFDDCNAEIIYID